MDSLASFHSTWFDAILIGVIVLSIAVSFFRGFLREAISLCSWVLAIVLALKLSSFISHHVFSWISSDTTAYVAAFISTVIVVLLLGSVITKLAKSIATITGFGIFDRVLGVLFGFLRGVLVTTLMIMLVNVTAFSSSHWFEDSAMKVALNTPEKWMQNFVPDELGNVSHWVGNQSDKLQPLSQSLDSVS
jgi:membrane protein required for colicin V production